VTSRGVALVTTGGPQFGALPRICKAQNAKVKSRGGRDDLSVHILLPLICNTYTDNTTRRGFVGWFGNNYIDDTTTIILILYCCISPGMGLWVEGAHTATGVCDGLNIGFSRAM
jgi:hypothetical protein